jgi:phospholipid/cholesterol/gamma-HCH transport system ATP-binding protein
VSSKDDGTLATRRGSAAPSNASGTDSKMNPYKIAMTGVKKAFGSKVVLDGIDLTVPKGESLVIIGGSGTGKSVLIKSILGIITPDAGSIKIDGEEVTGLRGSRRDALMRKFGMLFQGGALWENITFAVRPQRGLTKIEAKDMAVEKLKSVGLTADVAMLHPSELSGGMQKRVALARAICANPEIIFFDEPTTGLDPIMADVINDLIIKCTRELGLTTLSITHDMASACKIANNIAMIYQGKIIWHGRAQEIYHSRNEYVDQFVHGRAHGPITDGKK